MDEEKIRMRGRLAGYKREFDALEISTGSDITTIRNLIDPYEPDVTRLKTAEAKITLNRLHEDISKMKTLQNQIRDIEEALA